MSSSTHIPAVALGAAAAAAATLAAGATYAVSSTGKSNNDYHIIVFLDTAAGCSRNGKLVTIPKQHVQQLESAVCGALQIPHATLYLWDTKEQLHPKTLQQQLDQHLLNSSSYSNCYVVLLIASESGQLSKDAAALSPVRPPPTGPKPLPLVRNATLATRPYDPPL